MNDFTQEDYILILLGLNKLKWAHQHEMTEKLAGSGKTAAQIVRTLNADKTLLAIRALQDKLADKIIAV